jgi:DNA primase
MYLLESRIEDLLGPSRSHGVNRMWKCPWHDDSTASLSVNVEEGMFYCFGCGKKGNYDTLCKQFGETPDEEYKWERAKRSVEQGYSQPPDFSELVARDKGQQQVGVGSLLQDFIDERGIGRHVPEAFGLYVTHGPRIAFPYTDVDGHVNGIKYRDRQGHKTAEPGSSFHKPFGIGHAVGRPDVFIFEGESDTLLGYTLLGGKDGNGICGTSGVGVSDAQWIANGLLLLFARRIFLLYDADEAGDKCAETAMRVLGSDKCVRLRPVRGKDFTDHIQAGGTVREMLQ